MMVEDQAQPKREFAPPAPEAKLEQAKELVTNHPLLVVGGALAAGALVGFLRSRKRTESKGMLRGLLGGLAMALVREAVMDRVSSYANSWIDQKSREETASRQRETESFLEH